MLGQYSVMFSTGALSCNLLEDISDVSSHGRASSEGLASKIR